jgi:hypothetical protein
MNSPRLLNRHNLDNGLTLEFWDLSRPLVGDRRFVCLEALGEEIIFSQRQERNFIAASSAPALLQDMQDRILALAPGYLGHADFAARFIRKKCAARQELQQWQRLDTRGERT